MKHYYISIATVLCIIFGSTTIKAQVWLTYTSLNHVNDITIQDDTVWISTDGGIEKRSSDGSFIAHLDRLNGLPDITINGLAIDNNGVKWLATSRGAAMYDGTSSTLYNTSNSGIASDYLSSITSDSINNDSS